MNSDLAEPTLKPEADLSAVSSILSTANAGTSRWWSLSRTKSLAHGALAPIALILTAYALMVPTSASAQQRAITLIVPYAAGGGGDIIGREFANAFSQDLGQTVVVENRGGAAGFIGASAVARSRPDGATLLFAVNTNVTLVPHLQTGERTDLSAALEPVSHLSIFQYVVVVAPELGASTLQGLVEMARSSPPGSMTYSSTGVGSNGHLAGLLLTEAAGIRMEHIAYRGAAPAILDVIARRISINLSSPPPAVPLVRDGRLRALAVTGTNRLSALPEVPTLAEAGLPGISIIGWHGLFAPPGTPAIILDRYEAAARRAAASARFKARLESDGLEPAPERSRNAFGEMVRQENAFWTRKVRELDLKME
jgi:tripartite-type tricarboxylate transporter receptor subunit TctC